MALDNQVTADPRPAPLLLHYGLGLDEDRYVQVGDIRTRYRSSGDKGPGIILIHGLGSSLESWMRNLHFLGGRSRVFAPDVVWFGQSDKPRDEVTGDFFVRFITRVMDAIGLQRAVLVGNSMGGMIACKTALDHTERVSGLVLVDSAGFGRELAWWLRLRTLFKPARRKIKVSRWAARWVAAWIAYDWRTIGDEFIDQVVSREVEPEAVEAYARVLRFGADWRGLKPLAVQEIRDAAHKIRVPTLIIWGKQDRVIPVAHAEVARQRIPSATLHIIDRCGHAPMLEKPDEFNRLVDDFVHANIRDA